MVWRLVVLEKEDEVSLSLELDVKRLWWVLSGFGFGVGL